MWSVGLDSNVEGNENRDHLINTFPHHPDNLDHRHTFFIWRSELPGGDEGNDRDLATATGKNNVDRLRASSTAVADDGFCLG
jgi:hypothetical protein